MPKENKVVVSGVNVATRHIKPTQTAPQGGKVTNNWSGFTVDYSFVVAPMAVAVVAVAGLGAVGLGRRRSELIILADLAARSPAPAGTPS